MSVDDINFLSVKKEAKSQVTAEEYLFNDPLSNLSKEQKAAQDAAIQLLDDAHWAMTRKQYDKVETCYEKLVDKHKILAAGETSIDLVCDYKVLADLNQKLGQDDKAKKYETLAEQALKNITPICYDK